MVRSLKTRLEKIKEYAGKTEYATRYTLHKMSVCLYMWIV